MWRFYSVREHHLLYFFLKNTCDYMCAYNMQVFFGGVPAKVNTNAISAHQNIA